MDQELTAVLDSISPFDFLAYATSVLHEHREVYNDLLESGTYEQWLETRPWRLRCHGPPRSGKSTFAATVVNDIQQREGLMGLPIFLDVTGETAQSDILHQPDGNIAEALTRCILRQVVERKLQAGDESVFLKSVTTDELDVDHLTQSSINTFIALETVHLEGLFVVIDGQAEDEALTDLHNDLNAIADVKFGVMSLEDSARFPDWMRDWCDHCDNKNIDVYWCCKDCPPKNVANKFFCLECYQGGEKCDIDEYEHNGHVVVTTDKARMHILYEPYKFRILSLASNEDAIRAYVLSRLEDERRLETTLGVQLTRSAVHRLADRITAKALDNFVLARLNIEHLIEHQSLTDVVGTFARLPQFQNEYFAGLMRRIAESKDRGLAFSAILLSSLAIREARPFTTEELDGALQYHFESAAGLVTKETLGQVTNGILELDGELRAGRQTIKIFHPDVDTFLDEECEDLFEALHCDISLLCIKKVDEFLKEEMTKQHEPRIILADFFTDSFLVYAWEYWGEHLAQAATPQAVAAALGLLQTLDNLDLHVIKATYLIESIAADGDGRPFKRPYGSALHVCAHFGLVELAKQHLKGSSDIEKLTKINIQDKVSGTTALLVAVAQQRPHFVQYLLEEGADADIHDIEDHCPLSQAMNTFRLQSSQNKDISEITDIMSLLALKLSDAAINDHVMEGQTLLMLAVESGHNDVIDALLEHKNIDLTVVDARQRNLIHVAADSNNLTTLHKIADKHEGAFAAITSQEDAAGRTPLIALLQQHNVEEDTRQSALDLLESNGADLHAADALGRTILHHAISNGASEATITKLLDYGLDVEAHNHEERTALHFASAYGNAAHVNALINIGADQQRKDSLGFTAIDLAKAQQSIEVIELLAPHDDASTPLDEDISQQPIWGQISYDPQRFVDTHMEVEFKSGATAWQQNDVLGYTALHWAVNKTSFDAVRLALLSEHIEVNAKTADGQTALHISAAAIINGEGFKKQIKIMRELLLDDPRVDVDATDACGRTALQHALSTINVSPPGSTVRRCWELSLLLVGVAKDICLPRYQIQLLYKEAVASERYDLLQKLIDHGASPLRCRLRSLPKVDEDDDTLNCLQIAHRLSDTALLDLT